MLLVIDLIARVCIGSHSGQCLYLGAKVCIGSHSGQCLYLGDVPFMLYLNLSSLPIR